MTSPNTMPRVSRDSHRWMSDLRPIRVFNSTKEVIPPGACMELAQLTKEGKLKDPSTNDKYWAAVATSGEPMFVVRKPGRNSSKQDPSRYVFNGIHPIQPESSGAGYSDFPLIAAAVCINGKNHTTLGPKNGSWNLGPGKCWKLLTHDPTHAIGYTDAYGKWVHSVIIQPNMVVNEIPVEPESSLEAKIYSDRSEIDFAGFVEGESIPAGGYARESTFLTIAISGLYDIWCFGPLYSWFDDDGYVVPGQRIMANLCYSRTDGISGTSQETLLQLYRSQLLNRDSLSDKIVSIENVSGRVRKRMRKGDVIKLQNVSFGSVRAGISGSPVLISTYVPFEIHAELLEADSEGDSEDANGVTKANCKANTNNPDEGEEAEIPDDGTPPEPPDPDPEPLPECTYDSIESAPGVFAWTLNPLSAPCESGGICSQPPGAPTGVGQRAYGACSGDGDIEP